MLESGTGMLDCFRMGVHFDGGPEPRSRCRVYVSDGEYDP